MAKNTSGNARGNQSNQHGAHAPQKAQQDSEAKQKAQATAQEAKGQAKDVAQDAKAQAKDLAQSAQQEAGQLKDEAVQTAKDLGGTVQERLGAQAGTQQERVAAQARSFADDLHRLASGEQPENDAVRKVVTSVADRAEALTQRLETAQPADLLDDVRRFAARRPGTFLAIALGAGVIAGRMTRSLRDAAQPDEVTAGRYGYDARALPAGRTYGQGAPARRELEPEGVQSDVAPHHFASQVPGHSGDDAPRHGVDAQYGATGQYSAAPAVDPLTGERIDRAPYDQNRGHDARGGRA